MIDLINAKIFDEITMKTEVHDFGILTIGNHFIIGEMKEGIHVNIDIVSKIIQIANKNFKEEQWGYISNRISSYSLDPLVHAEAPKFEENMVAFAVVTVNTWHSLNAELEELISEGDYKFKHFVTVENAVSWVTGVLKTL